MPGCLSLFGQRGMAAFSMKDDLTGRFLRACIERNRGTKKAAAAAGKTYNTANIGNIKKEYIIGKVWFRVAPFKDFGFL